MLPEDVRRIISILGEGGYEAYAVGGCVRDSILGREPEDWDITTSATPAEIKKLFRRTVDTGIEHGTVTVLMKGHAYEVTTYRIDGRYSDGRHPDEVTFSASLEEDLKRRDFTINAMAYNDADGLTDLFGGMEDLEKGVIRCVGDPEKRFGEDALRMLRAVRFSGALGFEIDPATKQAVEKLKDNISFVSAERIRTEFVKLMISPHPEKWETAYETGLSMLILPEYDRAAGITVPGEDYSYADAALKAVSAAPGEKIIRLASFFACIEEGLGEECAKPVLRRLKFDNDTTDKVVCLVRRRNRELSEDEAEIRRMVSEIGYDLFGTLLDLADVLAQVPVPSVKITEGATSRIRETAESIRKRGDCVSLKGLAVDGSDLIALGMKPGPQIGEVLGRMLEEVLADPSRNDREYLLEHCCGKTAGEIK